MKKRYFQTIAALSSMTVFAFCAHAQKVVHVDEIASPIIEAPVETNEIFGRSVQGRPIYAHILGNGPDVIFILSAVHGNETATPYLVKELRTRLKRYPGWLQGRRVVLVPTLNPDGLQRRSRLNARGVDILAHGVVHDAVSAFVPARTRPQNLKHKP